MSEIIVKDIETYNENFYNLPVLYRKNDILIVKYKTEEYFYEPFRTELEKELNGILDDKFFKIIVSKDEKIIILTFKENDILYNFNALIEIVNSYKDKTFFIKIKNAIILDKLFKSCTKRKIKYILDPIFGNLLMLHKV